MQKLYILLIATLFSVQLSAQDSCGSNNNNQYKWLKKQCFDKQIKLLYADANGVVVLNSQKEEVSISYAALYDSLGLDTSTSTLSLQFPYNYVGYNDTILLTGSWDSAFRETGNVLVEPARQILTYSGSGLPYTQGTNEYVGMAISTDGGKTFIKTGTDGKLNLGINCEDPYLIKNPINGVYHLFVERKIPVGAFHDGIELFTSSDLITWTSQGIVIQRDSSHIWEEGDCSSPTVTISNGIWNLFYEGRSVNQLVNGGLICLATSLDGLTFTKSANNPIIYGSQWNNETPTGSWFTHLVPDDIKKVGDVYYMSVHAYNGVAFAGGVLTSKYLDSGWADAIGTWVTRADDVSKLEMTYYDYNGVVKGVFNSESVIVYSVLTSNPTTKEKYVIKTTATGLNKIVSGNQDQFIDAKITANRTFELGKNYISNAGTKITYYNNSAFVLTIDPDTGVLVNGVTTNITIPARGVLYFESTGINDWITYNFAASSNYTPTQILYGGGDGKIRQSATLAFDSSKSRLLVNDINGIADTNKITINGANFYSGGGDEAGAFNGTYSLWIGEQAGNRHVKDSNQTYDVSNGFGFGALENSHTSFSTAIGSGALKDYYGISTTAVGNDAGRNTKSTWFDINSYGGNSFFGLNAGRNSDSSSLVTALGIGAGGYNRYSRRSVYVGAGAGSNGTLTGRHHENVTAVGSNALATVSGKTRMEAYDYSSYGFENSLYQGGRRVSSFGKYGLLNTNPQFFTDVVQIGAYDNVNTNWLPAVVDSSTIIGNNIIPLFKRSFIAPVYQNWGVGTLQTSLYKMNIQGTLRLSETSLGNASDSILVKDDTTGLIKKIPTSSFTSSNGYTSGQMFYAGSDTRMIQTANMVYDSTNAQFLTNNGTAARPSNSFISDQTTGFWYSTNSFNISAGGSLRTSITNNAIIGQGAFGYYMKSSSGTQGAPTYAFNANATTGAYQDTINYYKISTGGTMALRIDPSQNISASKSVTVGTFMSLTPMSATAASALTPSLGMVVCVNSTNATFLTVGFWGYNGSAWTAF